MSPRQTTDLSIRRFSVASCDVVGIVGVDTLVSVVRVETEKLKVNVLSPSAVDTGSDQDVITTGAETIGGKSNTNLLLFSFRDMISQVNVFRIGASYT